MKQLMIGNEAVARGLYDGGCAVISSYPGTPSTEITECFAKFDDAYCEWGTKREGCYRVSFWRFSQRKALGLLYEARRTQRCG